MTESIVQRLREAAASLPPERVSMQALAQAHGPAAYGSWLLLMAVISAMPIPFGNVLPAIALMLIGLGQVFRDGVAVVLGHVMAGLAMRITAGWMLMVWAWVSERLPGWFSI